MIEVVVGGTKTAMGHGPIDVFIFKIKYLKSQIEFLITVCFKQVVLYFVLGLGKVWRDFIHAVFRYASGKKKDFIFPKTIQLGTPTLNVNVLRCE